MNTQVFEYDSEPTADIPVVGPPPKRRRRRLEPTRPVVGMVFGIGVMAGCLGMSVWHDFSDGLRREAVKDFLHSPAEREAMLAEAEQAKSDVSVAEPVSDVVTAETAVVGHAVNESTRIESLVMEVCGLDIDSEPPVVAMVEAGQVRVNGETVWVVDDVAGFERGDVVDFDCPQS